MSRTLKKTFFEHVLSSKMGRGVLAVAGGSGGQLIFDPKNVQKMFLMSRTCFFDICFRITIIILIIQSAAKLRTRHRAACMITRWTVLYLQVHKVGFVQKYWWSTDELMMINDDLVTS